MFLSHAQTPREFREQPIRLHLMRGLTVLTFLFVTLNVANWSRLDDGKPILPPTSITLANQALDDILSRAQAAGTQYTFDFAARDLDRLGRLSSDLQAYQGLGIGDADGPAEALALNRRLEHVRHEIGGLAMYHSGIRERGYMVETHYAGQAVQKYRQQHGDSPRAEFLPPAPKQDINWRHVAKRGVDGWLLAMLPAFLTIVVAFRLRRESLWAELVERPWGPVLAAAVWFPGLWAYAGEPGIIERRLRQLIDAYRAEHDASPSEEWVAAQRLVLMRRARDVQHALAQIAEAPELIRVNSRRAIFASWVIAMLSGPLQSMLCVAQAYAQVVRASGVDSSLVDTSRVQRRRSLTGFTDGNVETASDGRRLVTSGHLRGKLELNGDGLFVHVNRELKPLEAYATTQFGGAKVQAGMIVPYAVFDYPAPWNALFRTSQGFDLLPSFSDYGLQGETRAGPLTLQAGLLTGDGVDGAADDRHDVGLRLSGEHGALSASASYQAGDQHAYRAGNLTLAGNHGSVGYEYAHRSDDDPELAGSMHQLELIGQRGPWRAGVQLASSERQTLLGVLERSFGGFKRVMLECLATNGAAPVWTLRIQQGLKLATP